MAVAGTLLGTATADTSNTTSYATGSVTPTANALILVLVASSKTTDPDTPTLAGNGLTYVQVATVAVSAIRRVTVFRGMGASPSAGAVTATFGNNQTGCIIHVCQFTGTDTSGTNGSGAVVQSVTNFGAGVADLTVTLAALGSANNAAFGAFVGTDILAAGGSFTQLGNTNYATPTAHGMSEWALNQTAVFADITGTKDIAGVAVEVKAASLGQTVGAMAALGTATFPAPKVNLSLATAALGTASLSSPTVARGAVSITPAALGPATVSAPTVVPGAVAVASAALGTASVSAPTLLPGAAAISVAALGTATLPAPVVAPGAATVAPAVLGTASTAEPVLVRSFTVGLLGGGASLGALTLINRQLVSPDVLGTASLGSPQLNLSLPIPALGPASLGTPALAAGAAAISPAALGTATLPAPVVAPGAAAIAPAALGTASVVAPQLAYVIAPTALGPATLPAFVVQPGAVAITPALLGTASVVAPILTVPQTIGPFALLGGATLGDPALPVVINFTSAGTPFASTLNQATYSTVSWTPTANVLVLVAVGNSQGTAATVPTLAGNGLTWDQVATVATPALSPRCTVFRAWTGASPSTGALTASFGVTSQTGCMIHISEATGTSGAAANGGLAIAQSATGSADPGTTNPSITLGAFGQASNGTYGAFRGGANPAAGTGFSALAETTLTAPTGYLITEWRSDNDTTVDTITASSNFAGVALEIQNVIVPGAIGPMAALGPASLASPGVVLTIAPEALGPATVGAPQVDMAALIDVLGGATLADPTFALGAITAVIDDTLGGASVPEPAVVEGQTLIGPFDTLGGASTAEPIFLATSVLDALGGAVLAEFNVELRFYPALLGGATTASLEILAAPPPFDIPALGEAQLPNISLVMLVDVEVLGGATLGTPLLGAYLLPDALGTASLPDLVVAAGVVVIEAALLGGATVAAPDALHQSIGAFDVLGGASIGEPSLSQAIALDALGGAVLGDPQLGLLVVLEALGALELPEPVLAATNSIEPDALGLASLSDITLTITSSMEMLGGAQVFDPELAVAVVLIEPDVLGAASLGALQLNQAVVLEALGGASVADAAVAVAGSTMLPAALGTASLPEFTVAVGATSVGPMALLGSASAATPGFALAVVVPALGGSALATPALAYNVAPEALGGATTPAPTLQAGSIASGPFARLGGSVLKDMVVFTGYEYGPPPVIVGGRTDRPSMSGNGHGPRLTTRKRIPELV